jgi:hypothetical protein
MHLIRHLSIPVSPPQISYQEQQRQQREQYIPISTGSRELHEVPIVPSNLGLRRDTNDGDAASYIQHKGESGNPKYPSSDHQSERQHPLSYTTGNDNAVRSTKIPHEETAEVLLDKIVFACEAISKVLNKNKNMLVKSALYLCIEDICISIRRTTRKHILP